MMKRYDKLVFAGVELTPATVEMTFPEGNTLPAQVPKHQRLRETEGCVEFEMTIELDAWLHFLGCRGNDERLAENMAQLAGVSGVTLGDVCWAIERLRDGD